MSRAREIRTGALVVVGSALAGIPVGVLWWLVAPLVPIVKRADGLYRIGESNESAVAADGWLAILGVAAGIAIGLLVYLASRPGRVGPLLALAGGGVLGAVVAWRTGHLLGPGDLVPAARSLPVGGRLSAPLDVSAYGVLLTWPMAAVITYFAVAAGAETGTPADTEAGADADPVGADGSPVSQDGPATPSAPR
jgi:hypothetical protein